MCPEGDKLAMNEDILLPFDLPAVARKEVSAAFRCGRITSGGGVMLRAQAERRLGIADRAGPAAPKHYIDLVSTSRVRKKSRFRNNGHETAENWNSDHARSMGYRHAA